MLCHGLCSNFEKLCWRKSRGQPCIHTAVNGMRLLHSVKHYSHLRTMDEVDGVCGMCKLFHAFVLYKGVLALLNRLIANAVRSSMHLALSVPTSSRADSTIVQLAGPQTKHAKSTLANSFWIHLASQMIGYGAQSLL